MKIALRLFMLALFVGGAWLAWDRVGRDWFFPPLYIELPPGSMGIGVGEPLRAEGDAIQGEVEAIDVPSDGRLRLKVRLVHGDALAAWDPDSVFVALSDAPSGRRLQSYNLCVVGRPRGLPSGATVKGYAGSTPVVIAKVGIDNMACLGRIGHDKLVELQRRLIEAANALAR